MRNKILIVDDEPDILDILKYNLEKEGFEVQKAKNGKRAIEKAYSFNPDLILLDIMMPQMDGIEVCRKLRDDFKFAQTYIVFLTARSEEYSEVAGFDVGADDYVVKPIRPRSLISRLKNILKRVRLIDLPTDTLIFGELTIDISKHKIFINDNEVILTKKEYEILHLLASNPEKVFERENIYIKIWGNDTIVGERTLDVHIRKIRSKVGDKYVKTMKGVGYFFTH